MRNTLVSSCLIILLFMPDVEASAAAKSLPPLVTNTRNFGPGCHVKLLAPAIGEFPSTYGASSSKGGGSIILQDMPYRPGEWFFGFTCYDSDHILASYKWDRVDKPEHYTPIRFDEKTNQWEKDIQRYLMGFTDYQDNPQDAQWKIIDRSIRFHTLTTVNAKGFAYTQDDVIGDERYRVRWLAYCLIHPPKALCGRGEVGYLRAIKKNPKADLTPYALKILRSIEFIDDVAPPAPNTAPRPMEGTAR